MESVINLIQCVFHFRLFHNWQFDLGSFFRYQMCFSLSCSFFLYLPEAYNSTNSVINLLIICHFWIFFLKFLFCFGVYPIYSIVPL